MPSDDNRRFARLRPRGRVASSGVIVLDPRKPALDCTVIDISAGGACIDVPGQTPIPARAILIHSGTRKSCRVVWRRGRRLGLQY